MQKKLWKIPIPVLMAFILAILTIGTVGALNGWFGGGAKIPSDTITRGLVGYWSFDEGSGQTAFDATDNNNDGTLGTTTSAGSDDPKWTSGKVSGALQFDGTDDYVEVASSTSLNIANAVTVEAWVSSNLATTYQHIVSQPQAEVSDDIAYQLRISDGGFIQWSIRNSSGVTAYVTGTTQLPLNAFSHVVGVYDGTQMIAYVDGVEAGRTAQTGTIQLSTGNLRIGRRADLNFSGIIDEVRIYNRALSAEEVRYHYNRGGPVAHWTFDEGNGTTTYDSTENGNDGQFMTTTTSPTWVKGKYGTALLFDGTDDLITVTDTSSITNIFDDGGTLEFWINPVSDGESDLGFIMSKGTATVYLLTFGESGGKVKIRFVRYFSGVDLTVNTIAVEVDINTWSHLVVTYDNGDIGNVPIIYVNAIPVALSQSGPTGTRDSDAGDLIIGNHPSAIRTFNGLIDDVRIYNYVRTEDEIALDYNAGFATRFGPKSSCEEDPGSCMELGLVGYWDMEEGGGQYTNDGSQSLNIGTLGSSTSAESSDPKWTTGIKSLSGGVSGGSALEFDGEDDYVNVGNDESLDVFRTDGSKLLTIEVWVKRSINPVFAPIICRGTDGEGFKFWIDGANTDKIWFTTNGVKDYTFTTTISDTNWHHLILVYDSSYDANLYLDGVFQEKIEYSAVGITSDEPFYIGAYSPTSVFSGFVDDVRIYNRALSAEEVRYHYNRGGPVAHWTFDEGNGTTTYDSTENGNDGQFMTTTTSPTWVKGKYGTALLFDGVDDYVSHSGITFAAADSWTALAWVKENSADVFSGIMGQANTAVNSIGFRSTNKLTLYDDAGTRLDGPTVTTRTNWNQYGITYSNGEIYFIVNGVADGSYTRDTTIVFNSIGNNMNVGWMAGLIDDVRIYNYARTPDEIALDYNAGFAARFGSQSSCEDDPGSCMNLGLVGYWDFEEGGGTTTYDGSDENNNGQFQTVASSPKWTTGIKPFSGGISGGGALKFDGKDDYVDTGVISSDALTSYTVSMWLNSNDIPVANERIFGGKDNPNGRYEPLIILNTSGKIMIVADSADSYLTSDATIVSNTWYLITIVLSSNKDRYIYINGEVDINDVGSYSPGWDTTGHLIGAWSTPVVSFFDGLIDDVRVYNRALSAEEIRYHYNRGAPVAHWRFDEGGGTIAYDESTNNNDGTITGASTVAGRINSALNFDDNDLITVASDASLYGMPEITIGMWIKPNLVNTYQYLLDFRESSSVGAYYILLNDTNTITASAASGVAGGASTAQTIEIGQWYYLVWVAKNGQNGQIYLNTVKTEGSVMTGSIASSATSLIIGRKGYTGANYFSGLIDDVRIYNYARTPEQIMQDYNSGLSAHFQ